MFPLVSCICPTYGRAPDYLHLLEETVYWFLQQDYVHKELILLNDARNQILECDYPGVRVINHFERYITLGDKYNALCNLAQGSIILPWEDDDISLPFRITQAVEYLGSHFEYFNPQQTWYQEDKKLFTSHKHGICHNASAFLKSAWEKVEGYPSCSGDQDRKMDEKLKKLNRTCTLLDKNPSEWSYIYRWGVSDLHLSGYRDMQKVYTNRSHETMYVLIEPKLHTDYIKLTQAHII